MHPAFLPLPRRLLYALKPASWPKLLVPMAVGQVLGVMSSGTWSWGGAAVGVGFTAAMLCYLVLLNDWFDARVDAIKRQMFPDAGSPKTIPDAILHPQTVLLAGIGFGLVGASIALCGEIVTGRDGLALAGLMCLAMLPLYSAPPLRLNDRGTGELVEAAGVGVLLPWFNAYAQGGELVTRELLLVTPGLTALALASAIASGLADEDSDRAGGKATITTQLNIAPAITAYSIASRPASGSITCRPSPSARRWRCCCGNGAAWRRSARARSPAPSRRSPATRSACTGRCGAAR